MENPWKKDSKINPQKEEGHRRIATDVFIALAMAGLNGAQRSMIDCIIHYGWGYSKPEDTISINQFMEFSNKSERTCWMTIKELKQMHIIYYERVQEAAPNTFLFNKHYDTWTMFQSEGVRKVAGVQKVAGCRKMSKRGATSCKLGVQKAAHTIYNKPIEREPIEIDHPNCFSQFWMAYPKKESKQKAIKTFKTHQCQNHIDEILAFIEKAKLTDRWKKGYILNPVTFINQERWTDDLTAYNDNKTNQSSPHIEYEPGKYAYIRPSNYDPATTKYPIPEKPKKD